MRRNVLCLLLPLGLLACKSNPDEAQAPAAATQEDPAQPAAEPARADAAAEPAQLAKVEIPKEGKKLEPAVQPEQLPQGAWYCDMGTVHWAGMEKPADGNCPICGMALKQYDPAAHAAQKNEAVAPSDHAHDDGEHPDGHGEQEHGEHGHPH